MKHHMASYGKKMNIHIKKTKIHKLGKHLSDRYAVIKRRRTSFSFVAKYQSFEFLTIKNVVNRLNNTVAQKLLIIQFELQFRSFIHTNELILVLQIVSCH